MPTTKFSRFEKQKSLNYATIFSDLCKSEEKSKPSSSNSNSTSRESNPPSNSNSSANNNSSSALDGANKKPYQTFAKSVNAHANKVHSVSWSCDGGSLGSGSVDKTASICKIKPGSTKMVKVATCKGHSSNVDQVVFSPIHPDIFATAAHDKTVRFWDSRVKDCVTDLEVVGALDGKDSGSREGSNPPKRSKTDEKGKGDAKDTFEVLNSTHKIETKGENINLAWSPSGDYICVGNKYDLLSFIDMRTSVKNDQKKKASPAIVRSHAFKFEVNEFSWDTTGDIFTITTGQGSVRTYDFQELMRVPLSAQDATIPSLERAYLDEFQAHSSNCICLNYDPTGKYFAVGSNDVLVSLWDAKEYKPIRTYSELAWPVRTLSFSHDARLLAAASEDHFIDISLVEPIPGQMMWENQGPVSAGLQNNVNGKYRDRFTLGQSDQGDEFMVHSNKYLANRRTSSSVYQIQTGMPTFSVAWHPNRCILAYACDETDKDERSKSDSSLGNIRLFGVDI